MHCNQCRVLGGLDMLKVIIKLLSVSNPSYSTLNFSVCLSFFLSI